MDENNHKDKAVNLALGFELDLEGKGGTILKREYVGIARDTPRPMPKRKADSEGGRARVHGRVPSTGGVADAEGPNKARQNHAGVPEVDAPLVETVLHVLLKMHMPGVRLVRFNRLSGTCTVEHDCGARGNIPSASVLRMELARHK